MSELIAFRMPDLLYVRFKAWAAERGLGVTGALVALIERGLEGERTAPVPTPAPKPSASPVRAKTVAAPAKPPIGERLRPAKADYGARLKKR